MAKRATRLSVREDAMKALPRPDDWADLISDLWMASQGAYHPDLPPGASGPMMALFAVNAFFQKQHVVMSNGAALPLIQLAAALAELADGHVAQMFKPVTKSPGGRPANSMAHEMMKGLAARAMAELMEGGATKAEASGRVGRAIGEKPATVAGWRDRLSAGPGPGASDEAVSSYRDPLPPLPNSTPTERGERLLELLAARKIA